MVIVSQVSNVIPGPIVIISIGISILLINHKPFTLFVIQIIKITEKYVI